MRIVESKANPRLKELRSCLRQARPNPQGLVGLEGVHLVAEALRSGIALRTLFVEQGSEALLAAAPLAGFDELAPTLEVLTVPPGSLKWAATTESPQPIAALATPRAWKWPQLLSPGAASSRPLLVVLAGVQDPGNLGAILRSAEAFGASGAVCLPGTVSPWNAKAMRASAGSVFRLPLIAASAAICFERLRAAGVTPLAAMAHGGQHAAGHDLTGAAALVFGSEGGGLAPELASACDARITIPCPGPVESLNAAVAAGVLLYEAARQRTQAARGLSR